MKNKTLLITLLVLLAVLGVAAALYPKLSAGMQPQQIATVPTNATEPEETVKETEATEPQTTAATEPEPVVLPDFTVLDWDGNQVNFYDYLGKPVVLNFWAHWCGPCQMEMPEFNAMYEELGGDVTFLMVHVGQEVEEGKTKVTEGGYTFPVVFDDTQQVAGMYGISAFPTSLFINEEGHLKGYYMGMMDREMLQKGINLIYMSE